MIKLLLFVRYFGCLAMLMKFGNVWLASVSFYCFVGCSIVFAVYIINMYIMKWLLSEPIGRFSSVKIKCIF